MQTPMPMVQVKAIMASQTEFLLSKQWSKRTPCRKTKIFFITPDLAQSFDLPSNSRSEGEFLYEPLQATV
jgi:hypothetical protein